MESESGGNHESQRHPIPVERNIAIYGDDFFIQTSLTPLSGVQKTQETSESQHFGKRKLRVPNLLLEILVGSIAVHFYSQFEFLLAQIFLDS